VAVAGVRRISVVGQIPLQHRYLLLNVHGRPANQIVHSDLVIIPNPEIDEIVAGALFVKLVVEFQ